MRLVMFDIDETLVDTSSFEDDCFVRAINSVLEVELNRDWTSFNHVSDTGIVNELLKDVESEAERQLFFQRIRATFVELIDGHIKMNGAQEIAGAVRLFEHLQQREDVVLAIATGGWRETAELKLRSAGISYLGVALATSDDHFDRQKIMQIAQQRAGDFEFASRTYVGDGAWDKAASEALGFNFVLVGNKITHSKQVDDFSDVETVKSYLGL